MSFESIGVSARLSDTLSKQDIVTPNPVQRDTIPTLFAGRDAVIQAPTGSGKTLGFLLPLIQRLEFHQAGSPRALIVAPTRELATQISEVLTGLRSGLKQALIYGGVGYGNQLTALAASPDVVIGCPGRLLDLSRQRKVNFARVEYLVLDEADEMLDCGFAPDVERIIALTAATRQTVLASATVPDWVRTLIDKHLSNPQTIRVVADVEPDLEHGLLAVEKLEKLETLHHLLKAESGQTIVFHRTKHGAKKLARDLDRLGHFTAELQGNLSQNRRDKAITSFRRGEVHVLVATNVAARGLDVSEVGLVVNFELPDTADWLTHRVGRTARNGAKGRALTFLSDDDRDTWRKLRKLGAPDLRHVDRDELLESGRWIYVLPAAIDSSPSRVRTIPRRTPDFRRTDSPSTSPHNSIGDGQARPKRKYYQRRRRPAQTANPSSSRSGNYRSGRDA